MFPRLIASAVRGERRSDALTSGRALRIPVTGLLVTELRVPVSVAIFRGRDCSVTA